MSNNAPESNLALVTAQDCPELSTNAKELDPLFFQQVPNILINDVAKKRLKPVDVIVYAILKKHQGHRAYCWAGNSTVARLCGVSNATVRRSIKNLTRAGHIERSDCHKGLTAKTYFRTTVVNGRAVCGVPLLPPLQSSRMQTPVAPLDNPAPIVPPLTITGILAGQEIDADNQARLDAVEEEIEEIREADMQARFAESFQVESFDHESPI